MEKKKKPLLVRCPTCKKKGPWFEGPYGPFCSERCKLIDLGRWLGEEYRISEPLVEAPEVLSNEERNESSAWGDSFSRAETAEEDDGSP